MLSTIFISAAAARKLIFNPQPPAVSAGTPFNVSVQLLDRYGNGLDNSSSVRLQLASHPSAATALNLSQSIGDQGFANFDGVTLGTAGPYSLQATDGKLKAASKKFAVS